MMRTFAVGLVAISGATHEDGDALSLLQTSSSKFSDLSASKECKAATAAYKDAKGKVKVDKAAIKAAKKAAKEAKAAVKAAKAAKEASEKAVEDSYADMLEVCPIEEPDYDAPDTGPCSGKIVTSYLPGQGRDILDPRNCNAWNMLTNYLDGFTECLHGGGVPGGHGQSWGDKVGIAIMQPCTEYWTAGRFISPPGTSMSDYPKGTLGKKNGEVMFVEKPNLRNQSVCLDWCREVAPFPQSIAAQFNSNGGTTSTCRCHKKTSIAWKDFGVSLQLDGRQSNEFTCFMGGHAAWKKMYEEQQAANQLIDKCSKPEWARWHLERAEPPITKVGGVAGDAMAKATPFKPLYTGSGVNGMVINKKECNKVAKAEPACAKAVALSWSPSGGGACKCIFQTPSLVGNVRDRIDEYVCMF